MPDAIIVMGTPTAPDGTPSASQRERVQTAATLFDQSRTAAVILSGAAVHNALCEADTMAAFARHLGVPAAQLIAERRARNTIENLVFSALICRAHDWLSVLIVTSPFHVRRVRLMLKRLAELRPELALNATIEPCAWAPEHNWRWRLIMRTVEFLLCLRPVAKLRFFPDTHPQPTRPPGFAMCAYRGLSRYFASSGKRRS